MTKIILFFAIVLFNLAACKESTNEHIRFVAGTALAIERYIGTYVVVDTTGDGSPDVKARVLGEDGTEWLLGDSVVVDIRQKSHFASRRLKHSIEKSK